MFNQHDNTPSINTYRLLIGVLFFTILFGITGIKLIFYSKSSDSPTSHAGPQTIVPKKRGVIFDRLGKPLALSTSQCSLCVKRTTLDASANEEEAIAFLKEHYPLAYQTYKDTHEEIIWLKRNADFSEQRFITTKLPIAIISYEQQRYYPTPSVPQVTGYVNSHHHGITGIERRFNTELQNGKNITVSVDRTMSNCIQHELATTREYARAPLACALVLNPLNGQIITLEQNPTFNPNTVEESSVQNRLNHLITSSYEIGSLIMPLVGLAALSENKTNEKQLSEILLKHDQEKIASMWQNSEQVLYEHYMQCGFGQPTGIELTGERSGFVNPPERWRPDEPFSIAFGAESMGTMLQIGQAFSLFANNGSMNKLTILNNKKFKKQLQRYDTASINSIRKILAHYSQQQTITIDGYTTYAYIGRSRVIKQGSYSDTSSLYTLVLIIEKNDQTEPPYKRLIVCNLHEPTGVNSHEQAEKILSQLGKNIALQVVLHEQNNTV